MTTLHKAYFLPLACTNTTTIHGAHYRHAPQIYADAYRVRCAGIHLIVTSVLQRIHLTRAQPLSWDTQRPTRAQPS